MTAVLELDVRHQRYAEATVLQGLRLSLRAGEVVSLVGASGCGKSTLLRIAAGLERQFDGSVQLDGQPLTALTPSIGFIFQEPRLFPWLNVADNVAFSAGGRPGAGISDARALSLLAEVGLAGLERHWPKQLSGGQAQRAAIARGLYTQPRVLLLDEPFSAVDAFTRIKLQDLIAGLARRHGITLLLVTHDVDEAVQLSDRVLVMQARPGRFGEEIAIDPPRPRDRGDAALATAKAAVLRALYAVHAL